MNVVSHVIELLYLRLRGDCCCANLDCLLPLQPMPPCLTRTSESPQLPSRSAQQLSMRSWSLANSRMQQGQLCRETGNLGEVVENDSLNRVCYINASNFGGRKCCKGLEGNLALCKHLGFALCSEIKCGTRERSSSCMAIWSLQNPQGQKMRSIPFLTLQTFNAK